jgi:hypothetical protein
LAPITSPYKFSKQQHKEAFFSVSGFRNSTLRLNWWVLEYKCLTALGLKWPAWTIQKQNQSELDALLHQYPTKNTNKERIPILKFKLKGNWLREKCIHHLNCFVFRAVDTHGSCNYVASVGLSWV